MIFRVQLNPESSSEFNLLGFQWLEVLAIEPRAIANKGKRYGPWCYKPLCNWYICLTEDGLVRIPDEDFWSAIEAYKHSPEEKGPLAYQIIAAPQAVVQIHSPNARARTRGDKMRDKYIARQVGAQGANARSHNNQFLEFSNGSIDTKTLGEQLATIRNEMKRHASSAEDDLAIGAVASAELAATKGDAEGAMKYLKQAGKWAFDIATKLGTDLASKVISHSLQLND
jgi:hypothetical protein